MSGASHHWESDGTFRYVHMSTIKRVGITVANMQVEAGAATMGAIDVIDVDGGDAEVALECREEDRFSDDDT